MHRVATELWPLRVSLVALLLLFGAVVAAQSNVALCVKWKDNLVAKEDVVIARMADGQAQTVSARTDDQGKVEFKEVAAGEWTVLTGPSARLQMNLKDRVLGGLVGKPIALKDGSNQFDVDTGEYGYTQVELKVTWPDVVEYGRVELAALAWGSVLPVQEDSPVHLAWPGPHRLMFSLGVKAAATAIDAMRDMEFEHAVSVPEGPSCVIEPTLQFSRLKLKWKLPGDSKRTSVSGQLKNALRQGPGRPRPIDWEIVAAVGATEKDCGLYPCGVYAMHLIAASNDAQWHFRRDVELARDEESFDIDFKAPTGGLDVSIAIDAEGWDKADEQEIRLRLLKSGNIPDSVSTWVDAHIDNFQMNGLTPGKWTYELTGNGFLPTTGKVEVGANSPTKLDLKLKHAAGILVNVTGITWASYRWEFEGKDGNRLAPTTPDGASGVPNRMSDMAILIYAIPPGTKRIRFKVVGKADILLKVNDTPGTLQSGTIEIPEK